MQAKKAEEELSRIQELAGQLEGLEVIISMKTGEQEQLYESITPQKIRERLKELGYDVKKDMVKLENPIKELGEFPVLLEFDHGIEAKITVVVTEETEK